LNHSGSAENPSFFTGFSATRSPGILHPGLENHGQCQPQRIDWQWGRS
jgi:hypothetical protein